MPKGRIVAGLLAPHPPHLVNAENPPQNEPRSEGGWEGLRWGYERLRADLARVDYDVLMVLSPHWQTYVGWHFLGVPRFDSVSVDPVFPHLFRYRYGLDVDVALAEAVEAEARAAGLVTAMMRNPDFRVDYGTIVSCHMVNPSWDKPIVALSSCRSAAFYNIDVMQAQAVSLAQATVRAIEASGKRVVLLASNSLSHRHFTTEGDLPEDMRREHVTSHAQHLWDIKIISMLRSGRTREVIDILPEFSSQAIAETDAGSLTWMLAALGFPTRPAELYAYGTVIGTGNAVMGWFPAGDAMTIAMGVIVPGLPHPILCPDASPGYRRLRDAYDRARTVIASHKPDLLLVYSTMWPSVLGHQIQTLPHPEWVHVDELFHGLGSIPYRFHIDAAFGTRWCDAAKARGLDARTVAYQGFPIDTGTVVALKLLDPDNTIPATIVSSNIYADRAETIVLAKAAQDALAATGKRAVVVIVSTLSNRLHTDWIDPAADHVHSAKDAEWNQKLLEFLAQGRLEDVAQLSRVVQKQIRVKKVVSYKPMWFLSALMGAHNRYVGEVLAYEAVHGTGSAVVTLTPTAASLGDKEFDEEDVERWSGDREVLDAAPRNPFAASADDDEELDDVELPRRAAAPASEERVMASRAPSPVGAYPHARRVGELLYLSGVGPRQAGTNAIPGGPIRYEDGSPRDYDVAAQTRATIENVKAILEKAGSSLDKVVDVTAFLVDMDRDFADYNRIYAEYFTTIGATRTTLAVTALPTPIAVELKVIARA